MIATNPLAALVQDVVRAQQRPGPARHVAAPPVSGDSWDHREDHSFLLTEVPRDAWAHRHQSAGRSGLDAIVVPTSREPDADLKGVELALRLGKTLSAHVIILRSQRASEAPAPQIDADRAELVHVVDLSDVHPSWLGPHEHGQPFRTGHDVALKRNLAITVARALDWEQILFLDDDMDEDAHLNGLNADSIDFVSRWMRRTGLRAVGWSCNDFPDNSVVCHARRLAGFPQQTFIGAGAMLIGIDADTPYFPNTYNEDWLFLIALAAEHRVGVLARAGSVHQREYDPFLDRRVEREEMGDVLAECLLNLLEDSSLAHGGYEQAVDIDFWRRALRSRARHISSIRVTLARLIVVEFGRDRHRRRHAIAALRHAEQLNRKMMLTPDAFTRWVVNWLAQQRRWTGHLARVTASRPAPEPHQLFELIRTGACAYPSPRRLAV